MFHHFIKGTTFKFHEKMKFEFPSIGTLENTVKPQHKLYFIIRTLQLFLYRITVHPHTPKCL